MITVGIDIGSKYIKTVAMKNKEILGKAQARAGFDTMESAIEAMNKLCESLDITKDDIAYVVSTGAGREAIDFADDKITEIGAAAIGGVFVEPSSRTIIDVGAERGRAIKCDESGIVIDVAVHEECAAGAGTFTEAMARALEVQLEELGQLALKSTKTIPMNTQCTVFVELEVVSLLHAKTPNADIARAIHEAIASRIVAMTRKVGLTQKVLSIGGLSRNVGYVDALKRGLEMDLVVPDDPEYIGAIGAALVAADKVSN